MLKKMLDKERRRYARKVHIRKRISGTSECPRLSVFRSNKALSVQAIDDTRGVTLVSASMLEKELRGLKNTAEGGAQLGEIAGQRLVEKGIKTAVFDRNGYLYHGRVKAIAEGARKAGIVF
ncbi:MAG: 50S ribosomal protein L18 [Spirochaetaceae bacterium]|jgi:large subunit ribosomal protein L18|nr:50S ribosomal protein L18 [Spirochaetaceae bacterium]